MCRGANLAVMDLFKDPSSALTSSTIMAPCAWAPEAAQFAKANPELGETLNNKGVLKLLQGDVDAAEALFKQAKDKGIVEAETNLEEVSKKRKDIQVFGK